MASVSNDSSDEDIDPPPAKLPRVTSHCFCFESMEDYVADDTVHNFQKQHYFVDFVIHHRGGRIQVILLTLLVLGPTFARKFLLDERGGFKSETFIDLTSDDVEQLVSLVSKGQMNITWENSRRFVIFATQCDIKIILKMVSEFYLLHTHKGSSVFDLISSILFSEKYFCPHLVEIFRSRAAARIREIIAANSDLSRLPFNLIQGILSRHDLNLSEINLFRLLEKMDQSNAWSHEEVSHLIKTIRWNWINGDALKSIVKESHLFASKGKEMDRSISRCIRTKPPPRLPHELLVVLGGWSANGPCNSIQIWDTRLNAWVETRTVYLPFRLAYHEACLLGEELIIFGGFNGREFQSNVTAWNWKNHTWRMLPSMSTERCYVTGVSHGDRVYAIGGHNGVQRLSSVEAYNPMTNTWESVSDMQVRRSDASAVSFEGKIYVFGGFDGQTVHSTVEIFDPTTNTWTISSIPMTVPRSGLEAIVVKDRIFVLGGRDNSANRFRSVEVWHPTKPWLCRGLADMNIGKSNFTAAVIEQKLLVMGGYNDERGIINVTEAYNEVENRWITYPDVPIGKSALKAVTLEGPPKAKEWLKRKY